MGDRRSYHHGNLRAALIDAALALIGEKGALGFTIAEAARRAGVSAAAPYRHFKDREDLLAATAEAGFERFAERLEAAWREAGADPLRGVEAMGRAYLAFAREEPAYFAVIFEADPASSGAAGARAMEALEGGAAALLARLPAEERPPARMVACHLWAMAHGAASLFAHPGGARAPFSAEELLESGVLVYLRGLGLLPGEPR